MTQQSNDGSMFVIFDDLTGKEIARGLAEDFKETMFQIIMDKRQGSVRAEWYVVDEVFPSEMWDNG